MRNDFGEWPTTPTLRTSWTPRASKKVSKDSFGFAQTNFLGKPLHDHDICRQVSLTAANAALCRSAQLLASKLNLKTICHEIIILGSLMRLSCNLFTIWFIFMTRKKDCTYIEVWIPESFGNPKRTYVLYRRGSSGHCSPRHTSDLSGNTTIIGNTIFQYIYINYILYIYYKHIYIYIYISVIIPKQSWNIFAFEGFPWSWAKPHPLHPKHATSKRGNQVLRQCGICEGKVPIGCGHVGLDSILKFPALKGRIVVFFPSWWSMAPGVQASQWQNTTS